MVQFKCTVQLGFRRKSWIEAGWTEEVECEGSMGDEAVPEIQGGVGVVANEAGYEVILVSLYCAFCGVGAMKVWGTKLEPYAGIAQKSFEAAGAFIVGHMVLGCEAAVREVGVKEASGPYEFAFVARGGWLH